MNLPLDARQRAMLQEMGVRVWWPAGAPETAAADPQAPPASSPAPEAPARPATVRAPASSPAATAPAPAASRPSAPPASEPATGTLRPAFMLRAPQLLYPGVDPQQAPAGLGACWLIVTEGLPTADPLSAQADRLFDNMLRALQLHRHPRVFLSALEHPGPGSEPASAAAPATAALADAVAALQPCMVLVMGRVAAREVLGRSEPLGRLRTEPHCVAGVPAIVTYDAPYLLRAPNAKPAAWADLCRARALVRATAPS